VVADAKKPTGKVAVTVTTPKATAPRAAAIKSASK
jgi:hypothetical protein